MELHESAEDYLEKILMIEESRSSVRSIDIVNLSGYSKPSISIAMKRLRENGFIEMDHSGLITLTANGRDVAEGIYNRHKVLTDFFKSLGVSAETSAADACRVEHDISTETFAKITEYLKKRK